jgi:hypothetical protein
METKDRNEDLTSIVAVSVNKKLPLMNITNLPKEFVEDVKAGKNPSSRYYLGKI